MPKGQASWSERQYGDGGVVTFIHAILNIATCIEQSDLELLWLRSTKTAVFIFWVILLLVAGYYQKEFVFVTAKKS